MNPGIDKQYMTTVTLAEQTQGLQITGTSLSTQSLTAVTYLTGPPGADGAPGPSNSLAIGTVSTGAPNTSAEASITGTSPDQILNLTIPQGPEGEITGITLTDSSGTVWNLGVTTNGNLVTYTGSADDTFGTAFGTLVLA